MILDLSKLKVFAGDDIVKIWLLPFESGKMLVTESSPFPTAFEKSLLSQDCKILGSVW